MFGRRAETESALPARCVCDVCVCRQRLCHSFAFMNVWVGAGEPVPPLVLVLAQPRMCAFNPRDCL